MADYTEKANDIVADFDYDRPHYDDEGGDILDWKSAAMNIAKALKEARNEWLA